MGEFEFIESIRRAFEGVGDRSITGIGDGGNGHGDLAETFPQDSLPRSEEIAVSLGIGDDCAVLSIGGSKTLVVTTDMLVEGVHFLRSGTSARELGAKSLAVNLSDVAAMGARPVASFLSIALPSECHDGWAAEFMEGYRELSARHGVRLAGGDTTSSLNGVAINVTAIGHASLGHLKYRSGARVGDIVVVGGPLGESAAGLRDILEGRPDTALAHIHRNPIPQVEEGEWLGTREEVHSMIDLSDGLASDLVHILRASGRNDDGGLGAEIELETIPAPVGVEFAVTGGEDYKLLFTVAADSFERLAEDYLARFGEPLHPVGRIAPGAPEIRWLDGGVPVAKEWRGFVHF